MHKGIYMHTNRSIYRYVDIYRHRTESYILYFMSSIIHTHIYIHVGVFIQLCSLCRIFLLRHYGRITNWLSKARKYCKIEKCTLLNEEDTKFYL